MLEILSVDANIATVLTSGSDAAVGIDSTISSASQLFSQVRVRGGAYRLAYVGTSPSAAAGSP